MISGVKLKGSKELRKELSVLNRAVRLGVSEKGLVSGALTLQKAAQNRAPIDTGNLRASGFSVFGAAGKSNATIDNLNSKGMNETVASKLIANYKALVSHVVAKQKNSKGFSAFVAFGAFYSPYVHEGTKKMKSRPFLLEALIAEKMAIAKAIKTGVVQAIKSRKSLIQEGSVFKNTTGGSL